LLHFLHTNHNFIYVILSFIIAAIASYASIELARQIDDSNGRVKRVWLLLGGLSLGIGIWSMHFIAMISYQFETKVYYDIWYVTLSIIFAIIACVIGYYFITYLQRNTVTFILSGSLMGIGIGLMHYVGMTAIQGVEITYDDMLVFLSVIIAIIASMTALLIGFVLPGKTQTFSKYRKVSFSIIMAIAISSMHYTGMAAAHFDYNEKNILNAVNLVDIDVFKWIVIITTFTLFFVVFFLIFYYKLMKNTLDLQDTLINSSEVGIVLTDSMNKMIRYNHEFANLMKQLQISLTSEWLHMTIPFAITELKAFDVTEIDYRHLYLEVTKVPVQADDEKQYLWYFRDITEKKEKDAMIHRLAYYNEITHLPNSNMLEKQLNHWQENHINDLTCIYIRVDRLRFSLGSTFVDEREEFIRKVALLLRVKITSQEYLFHYDDQVIVIFVLKSNKNYVHTLLEHLLAQLSQSVQIKNTSYNLTFNIGISKYPEDTTNLQSIVNYASLASLESSKLSRNNYMYFEKTILDKMNRKVLLDQAMTIALNQDEFYLVYQPIICTRTDKVASVEVLLRWNSPEFGFISPAEFIPIAEETGFINRIGKWVLEKACMQWTEWKEQGKPLVHIAINVSAIQLANHQFIEMIEEVCNQTGMDPTYLELEITESSSLNYHESLHMKLNRLSEMGIGLSLDDFGTGYSSFEHLKELAVHKLKIDRSFIFGLLEDSNQEAILRSIIQLGHNLKKDVLMEGVEQVAEVEWLKKNHCDYIQGYYYAKPLEAMEVMEYIIRTNQ
jgi:diguanylate cyclase